MKKLKYSLYYNSFATNKSILKTYPNLKYPQLAVFSLILAILESNDTCTQVQVCKANGDKLKGYSGYTTAKHINILKDLGLISKKRSNQFFSPCYITLTKEGLLLKSRISSLLSSKLNY